MMTPYGPIDEIGDLQLNGFTGKTYELGRDLGEMVVVDDTEPFDEEDPDEDDDDTEIEECHQ